MRILVLSDKVLSQNTGDGLRVYGLLKPLLGRHTFDLICFARSGEQLSTDMRSLFDDVTLVPAPEPRPPPLLRKLVRSATVRDFKPTSGVMRGAIEAALRGHNYHLLLDVAANTVANLPGLPLDVPLVVDSIDEPLLREARAMQIGRWRDRAHHLYRAWQFWLYERQMLGRAAINLYVSDVDARAYTRFFPSRTVAVVPNGVDIDYFAPSQTAPEPDLIVFEGNMNFPPNIDTAIRLVQDVLPRVQRSVPAARVCLVGRDPASEVVALASARVEVTGTVDDVRPYLARAAVFACPMRLGSGIKNKILQAWAMARPVVATPESLGGLAASNGVNLLVRSSPEAFAGAIVQLLNDDRLSSELGQNGRETVEREYSWNSRAAEFERFLVDVAEKRGAMASKPATVGT